MEIVGGRDLKKRQCIRLMSLTTSRKAGVAGLARVQGPCCAASRSLMTPATDIESRRCQKNFASTVVQPITMENMKGLAKQVKLL